jgi:DNA-directed RNA polymerase subunit F
MNKRTIIILTVISTIFSLVYILANYFGYIRYFSIIHQNNSDKLIENYSKLEMHKAKQKVVLSISVKPGELEKIRPLINSILDQTVRVDQIALIMNNNDDINKLPEYLRKIVVVFPSGKDYGKGNNIVPLLLKEKESDTIIIGLYNNVVYGKDFLEVLLDESNKNPDAVILDHKKYSILLKPEHYGCEILKRDQEKYDEEWFLANTKRYNILNYGENYKYEL